MARHLLNGYNPPFSVGAKDVYLIYANTTNNSFSLFVVFVHPLLARNVKQEN